MGMAWWGELWGGGAAESGGGVGWGIVASKVWGGGRVGAEDLPVPAALGQPGLTCPLCFPCPFHSSAPCPGGLCAGMFWGR